MTGIELLLASSNISWHVIPLSLVISLVYSASRYEMSERILSRAFGLFIRILLFMAAAFALLWVLDPG